MSIVVSLKERKDKKDEERLIYSCSCKAYDPNNYHSSFYIYVDGYECIECGKQHSFEQVHGGL